MHNCNCEMKPNHKNAESLRGQHAFKDTDLQEFKTKI